MNLVVLLNPQRARQLFRLLLKTIQERNESSRKHCTGGNKEEQVEVISFNRYSRQSLVTRRIDGGNEDDIGI